MSPEPRGLGTLSLPPAPPPKKINDQFHCGLPGISTPGFVKLKSVSLLEFLANFTAIETTYSL